MRSVSKLFRKLFDSPTAWAPRLDLDTNFGKRVLGVTYEPCLCDMIGCSEQIPVKKPSFLQHLLHLRPVEMRFPRYDGNTFEEELIKLVQMQPKVEFPCFSFRLCSPLIVKYVLHSLVSCDVPSI